MLFGTWFARNIYLWLSISLLCLSTQSFSQSLPQSSTPATNNYPDRPIKLVVPYAAGGATDVMARLITPKLSQTLGQTVVVENRPGAATVIGTTLVINAPADGYTILQGSAALAITPSTMSKIPYDVQRDLIPVIQTSSQGH